MKKFLLFFAAIMLAVPSMLASEVEFSIEYGDGIDLEDWNQYQKVLIWNDTESEPVNVDGNFFTFDFDAITILRIDAEPQDEWDLVVKVLDGLDEIPASQLQEMDLGDLYEDEGQWWLTLGQGMDGYTIKIYVYPEGEAPSDGDKISSVNVNFNIEAAAGSNLTSPQNYITVQYFDNGFQPIPVITGSGNADVKPGTTIDLIPDEGYMITDIKSYVQGIATISPPSDPTDEWNISIDSNPSGDYIQFVVTVAKAPATFNLAFTGNLNGAEWNQVTVSSIAAPTNNGPSKYPLPANFTITPKDGYEITGYSISNGSTEVEDLSAYGSSVTVANGVYTFDLSEQVNGFTFTLTVEEIVKGTPITFNFTGEGYEYVNVLSGAIVPVPVDNNNFTYIASLPLDLTFSPKENYDLTVTTNAPEDSDVSVLGNGKGGYTVSIPEDGTIPANFTITIDVFEAVVEPTEVPVTVNFTLELPEGVTSNVVEIIDMNTSLEVTPVDNAFEVTVDPEDEEGVTIQLSVSSDYLFNLEECYVSEGSLITLSPSSDSRILNVEIPYSMKNENAEVYISVKEAEVGEDIPVNFNVSEYPGLIAGLSFNGKETVITNDSQLENYVVNILEGYEEDALTIVYGTDSEGKLLYTVEKVTAQYVATTEEGLETYSCEVLPFQNYCIVSIPADADAVSISFEAKAPTVGVNSLNAVNEDAVIYNIQGVRVNSATLSNGLYVINGKKVIIRK